MHDHPTALSTVARAAISRTLGIVGRRARTGVTRLSRFRPFAAWKISAILTTEKAQDPSASDPP